MRGKRKQQKMAALGFRRSRPIQVAHIWLGGRRWLYGFLINRKVVWQRVKL
jgi:hypothetical protein